MSPPEDLPKPQFGTVEGSDGEPVDYMVSPEDNSEDGSGAKPIDPKKILEGPYPVDTDNIAFPRLQGPSELRGYARWWPPHDEEVR